MVGAGTFGVVADEGAVYIADLGGSSEFIVVYRATMGSTTRRIVADEIACYISDLGG